MTGNAETPPQPFTFSLATSPNLNRTKNGTLQLVDSSFKVSTTIAVVVQTVPPGAMRAMRWHLNADEWQYYIKGKARMGVFNTGPQVLTMDFNPAISATSLATTGIMCKTSVTLTCNSSPRSGHRIFRR